MAIIDQQSIVYWSDNSQKALICAALMASVLLLVSVCSCCRSKKRKKSNPKNQDQSVATNAGDASEPPSQATTEQTKGTDSATARKKSSSKPSTSTKVATAYVEIGTGDPPPGATPSPAYIDLGNSQMQKDDKMAQDPVAWNDAQYRTLCTVDNNFQCSIMTKKADDMKQQPKKTAAYISMYRTENNTDNTGNKQERTTPTRTGKLSPTEMSELKNGQGKQFVKPYASVYKEGGHSMPRTVPSRPPHGPSIQQSVAASLAATLAPSLPPTLRGVAAESKQPPIDRRGSGMHSKTPQQTSAGSPGQPGFSGSPGSPSQPSTPSPTPTPTPTLTPTPTPTPTPPPPPPIPQFPNAMMRSRLVQ